MQLISNSSTRSRTIQTHTPPSLPRPPSLSSTSQFLGPLNPPAQKPVRGSGEERKEGKEAIVAFAAKIPQAEGHVCCFCRQNPLGIALNFHQVSSRTPALSIRKSIFLAGLSGAETVCLWRTETVCLWRTETVCLCGTETLSLCGTETLCLCGTETGCLCEEHRIWRGGLPAPPAPPRALNPRQLNLTIHR